MAFDQTDPADLAALKSEEANDPISMGYAAVEGQTKKTLALFNDGDLNVGGQTTGVTLTVEVLFDQMVAEEFGGNQVDKGELMWLTAILNFLQIEPNKDIEKWKVKIIALAPNNSITESNINGLSRRQSRAEILFGLDTVISKSDWLATRAS